MAIIKGGAKGKRREKCGCGRPAPVLPNTTVVEPQDCSLHGSTCPGFREAHSAPSLLISPSLLTTHAHPLHTTHPDTQCNPVHMDTTSQAPTLNSTLQGRKERCSRTTHHTQTQNCRQRHIPPTHTPSTHRDVCVHGNTTLTQTLSTAFTQCKHIHLVNRPGFQATH